jgi:D-aspartate ligase
MQVEVHLAHAGPRRADSRSRWLESSLRLPDSSEWLAALMSVGKSLRARSDEHPILMTVDDPGAFFVDEHDEALATVFTFPRQPAGLVERLSNKAMLNALCARMGIPTPAIVVPESQQRLREMAASVAYPVAIKVADGRLRREASVSIVEGPSELVARASEMLASADAPNLILQEFVPGGASDVWMFNGYFDAESRMRFAVTGRKLRQYPPGGGVTAFGVTAPNARVQQIMSGLASECGYRGPIDVGFRYDHRDDEYKLLDVNPRLGATFRLFVDSRGLDVARATYLDLAGAPLPAASPAYGRTWMVENYDLRALLGSPHGRLHGLRRFLRAVLRADEAAWFATDDLAPFLGMIGQSVGDLIALIGKRVGAGRASGGGPVPAEPSFEA